LRIKKSGGVGMALRKSKAKKYKSIRVKE